MGDDHLVRELRVYATEDWSEIVVVCKGDCEASRPALWDRLYAEAISHGRGVVREVYRRVEQDHALYGLTTAR